MHWANKCLVDNGGVDLAQDLLGLLAFGANDNPVGMQEVLHGRAFSKKLGIRGDVELCAERAAFSEIPPQLRGSLNRDRTFFNDQLVTSRALRNDVCKRLDNREVYITIG